LINNTLLQDDISIAKYNSTTLSPSIINDLSNNIQYHLIESPLPVILYISAPWCKPCTMLQPLMEEILTLYHDKFRYIKIDSDNERDLVDILQVRSLPTVFTIMNGFIIDRYINIITL
jgi:thioredoxin-like negative regulator of GroEL